MAGRLLFVFLTYSFHKIQVQALLRPTLTVNPPMITETDSVTLNCQTPPSVSVSQCYFYTVSGGNVRVYSCLKSMTGTELLRMTSQSSPAEVKLKCYYTVKHGELNPPSLHSDTASITIHTLLPPTLTVNPVMITETDSVTFNCQTPPSVSVSQCYFYTVSGGNVRVYSCLKSMTGAELLGMTSQSSPAEVKLKCYYTVKHGELNPPSPHSDAASIIVQRVTKLNEGRNTDLTSVSSKLSPLGEDGLCKCQHCLKPKKSLQHFHGDLVIFTCSLPGSANHDTRCNLYFGEARRPIVTAMSKKNTKTLQWFCQFSVRIDDFLRRLSSVQQKDASCDYSLGSEPDSLSPRSDGYSLIDIVERESSVAQTMSTATLTRGLTVHRSCASTTLKLTSGWTVVKSSHTGGSTSTSLTGVNTASGLTVSAPETEGNIFSPKAASAEMWIWKTVAVVSACIVTVGIISLVSVILWNKRKDASPKEVRKQEAPENEEDYIAYYLCSPTSEEPAASALKDMVYSTVQMH